MEDIGDIMTDVTVNVFVTHSTICKTLRTKSSRKCKVPSLQRKFTRDTIRAFASPPALRNLIMLNHVTQITIISDKMRHTCSAITTLELNVEMLLSLEQNGHEPVLKSSR